MSQLKIETTDSKTAYLPGDEIKGIAVWQLDKTAEAIEVRLFWRTEGRAVPTVDIGEKVRFENPSMEGGQPFVFHAPNGPYSFTGRFITLLWGIELVILPKQEAERINIVISPTGEPISIVGQE